MEVPNCLCAVRSLSSSPTDQEPRSQNSATDVMSHPRASVDLSDLVCLHDQSIFGKFKTSGSRVKEACDTIKNECTLEDSLGKYIAFN